MSTFVKNAWYVAAWSKEIRRKLLPRTILGEQVVLYRREDGTPAALVDRCPHKLAPLSLGELKGDQVQCGYHGMTFDCSGTCVRVPGQQNIPPTARVRSFPLVEKYNAVWIWMGEPHLADAKKIVDVPHYGEPGWGWGLVDGQYVHFRTNYLNITDNLVDPAHTTYVHKSTIGNAAAEDVGVKVEQGEDHVLAYRWIYNASRSRWPGKWSTSRALLTDVSTTTCTRPRCPAWTLSPSMPAPSRPKRTRTAACAPSA